MDTRLLTLRADLYRASGEYNRARGTYIAAKAAHVVPETVNDLATTCYELGGGYTAALDGLLDYLAASAQTEERDADIDRASRFKELIKRELALITSV